MSDDRALLEAAAKAAGIIGNFENDGADAGLFLAIEPMFSRGRWTRWHPLRDDGDALRLACELRIEIEHSDHRDQEVWVAAISYKMLAGCVEVFEDESHRLAATRRAIVRAAASISGSTVGTGEDRGTS